MPEEKVDEGVIRIETVASYTSVPQNHSGSPLTFHKAKIVLRQIEEQYQIELFVPPKVRYFMPYCNII